MADAAPRHARGHADQVRALFDNEAAGWPGKYAADGRLAGRLTELADAVRTRVVGGAALLDLGCGSGELALHLAASGYRVTGCDIAPRMLRRAAAADRRHDVSWIQLDPRWRTLPFAPSTLDAVIVASVLEYVPDPSAVLHECARVLRPGGILLCTVPDLAHPVRWLEWPLGLAARIPLARAASGAWPRVYRYVTYLQLSRQRRESRWWHAAATRAGLQPAPPAVQRTRTAQRTHLTPKAQMPQRGQRAPLRLLAFTRPGDPPWPRIDTIREHQ